MKYYSELIDEFVWIGEKHESLVCYSKTEIEHIKTLRRCCKSDTKFSENFKTLHAFKKALGGVITDWEIPWVQGAPSQSQNQNSENESAFFWMQAQQDYLKATAEKIKSLTQAKKSAKRYENILKHLDTHKYR